MEWYRRLTNCLKETESALERVLVCGDFNVAPNDEDVHDPALWRGAIMCSEGERAAFRALEELGLADTLRLHHPEPGIFSWWDYRMLAFPKNRGLRIDAILAGSELAAKCSDAGVDREMRKGKDPSDHAPVWAEFGSLSAHRRLCNVPRSTSGPRRRMTDSLDVSVNSTVPTNAPGRQSAVENRCWFTMAIADSANSGSRAGAKSLPAQSTTRNCRTPRRVSRKCRAPHSSMRSS